MRIVEHIYPTAQAPQQKNENEQCDANENLLCKQQHDIIVASVGCLRFDLASTPLARACIVARDGRKQGGWWGQVDPFHP